MAVYLVIKAFIEILEKISEEVSVGVFAELIENKPVTKITEMKNITTCRNISLCEASCLDDQKQTSDIVSKTTIDENISAILPEWWNDHDSNSKNKVKEGNTCKSKQPKPEQKIDLKVMKYRLVKWLANLFIDDVEAHNTKTVELLLTSSSTN